ncbi:hypothetical protein V6N11_029724 [Hibiscus sabdariffa]|uniref:NADP-dependent oxidoreductase domain-containing protein n=1 Tax=Hibiscus sabdariffa TaxID=183260 RepID=A0ABR2P7Y6_9ROSI
METKVGRIKLGTQGLEVSVQGLGCMSMSASYGPLKPELDMINLVLRSDIREQVELATKFGACFVDGKREIWGNPAYVREACEASLKRLGLDCIDLYYQLQVDTRVPIEITNCLCGSSYNCCAVGVVILG